MKNPTLKSEVVESPSRDTMERWPAQITSSDQMPGPKQLQLDEMCPIPSVGFDQVKTLVSGHY